MSGFQAYLAIIITIGGIFYIYGQFRNGGKTNAKDTIDLLEKRAAALEMELKEERTERKKDHDELTRLKERLEQKEGRIKDLELILENRDPAMLQFMKMVSNFTLTGQEYMKTTSENLKTINAFMERIELKLATIK